MSVYHTTSLSSCIGCGVQKHGTFTHAAGSTSAFVVPICDCGEFVVLGTTTRKKKCQKTIMGLSQVQGKIYSIRFDANLRMLL